MTPAKTLGALRTLAARLQRVAAIVAATAALGVAVATSAPAGAATALAEQPVLSITGVPGNVALALSVEFPTAISVAHQGAFATTKTYIGYFDPLKCYRYRQGTQDEVAGDDKSHFYPVAMAVDRKCTALDDTWSGNFLNWLTMQAIDPFRWALTGGLRVVDNDTTTILERAWSSGQGSAENFPDIPYANTNALKARPSPSATDIAENTPLSVQSLKVSVRTRGNRVYFTDGSYGNTPDTSHYQSETKLAKNTLYYFYARVKVCDSGTGYSRESNCVQYASGWKPEGLLQQYAEKMRFSAFGYLNEDTYRDGGVLRARMKYVGPNTPVPGAAAQSNAGREWNPTTGVMYDNPDSADASATATAYGVTVSRSGVINYVNRFGQDQKSYKTYDPVSELYYGVLRYLKAQGSVAAWTSGIASNSNKARLVDGFPVITNWEDPIQYSCQRNFVLGIGDVNTHYDRNLPGSSGTNDSPRPSEIGADTTVDATTATNKVGSLHGIASLATKSQGNGSYLMAGLAYDANTVDIRPDDATKPQTKGMQTVRTYWLDVVEYGVPVANNQYYLAAKYGGFKVPKGFAPYTRSTDIDTAWWYTNGEKVTGTGQNRPDTYYTVSQADDMVEGLRQAFASIASETKAYTTSFTTALPTVSSLGSASYAASYDASTWTGDLVASTATFNAAGDPTTTEAWSFRAKLATQLAGDGWNTGRRVVTWRPASGTTAGAGVAFRSSTTPSGSAVSATQLSRLDTSYRAGVDGADYLNYLRGDRTHEAGSGVSGGSNAYRAREALLGDIVGSKARPVGPPSSPYSEAANPGYAAFKSARSGRPTMVYVGSNAGMLHAVNGALTGTDAGKEVFAYVPDLLFDGPTATPAVNGLQSLGKPDYEHHPMVDGSVVVADVDFARTRGGSGAADWHSVLIGAMGKGGKGYYAIDVTDPAGMTSESIVAGKVLWEFKHAKLGYTYGEPAIVKTAKYGWVAIFASGYNNSDGQGYFFIVNPRTGALLEDPIPTGAGSTSADAGLAHVQAFILDRGDGTADSVYAGDLLGNLWRLDLRGNPTAYPAPVKLAELLDGSNNALPVTTRPLVVVQPGTNIRFVTVGTGRLLASSDKSSQQRQAFFAIKDGTGNAPGTAAQLPRGVSWPVRKTNLKELTDLTTKVSIDTTSQVGWWLDLGTATGSIGWRVVVEPTAFNGAVAFATMVPTGDACNPGGTSRVYAIDLGTGQSKLKTGTTTIAYANASGVVADLRFLSVSGSTSASGSATLVSATQSGEIDSHEGNWTTGLGMRRLNWRELQTAD